MPKFRKKPVVIEAIQWDGKAHSALMIGALAGNDLEQTGSFATGDAAMIIPTLEGNMKASIGDYIIKGVKGEIYPCKPDIFEATYEAVE